MTAPHSRRRTQSIGWLRAQLRPNASAPKLRWLTGAAGVIGSLLLHVLLLEAVLADGFNGSRPRREPGLGADMIVSDEHARATLILIDASALAAAETEAQEKPASAGTQIKIDRLTIISPVDVREPAFDLEVDSPEESSAADNSDRRGRAQQFGMYLRQIQARIERGWLRPRSPIEGETFSCRAQVLQSVRGEILEVTLQRCDADGAWQLSLVRAIERASPLPAPPDPLVFSETIQLAFRASPFDPNGSTEGFEPLTPALLSHEALRPPSR